VLLDKPDAVGIGGIQLKIIQQHREMGQPLLPGLLRDIVEDSLSEGSWMSKKFESGGFPLELLAKNSAWHVVIGDAERRQYI